ncbi:MAG TPA: thermonuclease family protein [Pyrinomonadaceae bacterium]|nr:thermonuclease family protein [Pyrinomonadaceae bacterium]
MKIPRTLWTAIAFASLLIVVPRVNGAAFLGKVIEVNEGDVITVSNQNRPVRVRLLGVDAPELTQPFGDVAKQHLSDLVMDKIVLVQSAGYTKNYALIARVLVGDRDICAQMIRDGAAWFDPKSPVLTPADGEIYTQSQIAARNERRGLWQVDNPVAPWDFVKASKAQVSSASAPATPLSAPRKSANSGLTTEGLRWANIAASRPPSDNSKDAGENYAPEVNGQWRTLRPAGEKFSVLVPVDGKSISLPVPSGDRLINFHIYMGRQNLSVYQVMWVTGPSMGESDADAINGTMQGFLRGMASSFEARNGAGSFQCETPEPRTVSMKGYTGQEFNFQGCTLPGVARVFTKLVGDDRRMYVFGAFYKEKDANIGKFLKSFEFVATENTTARNKN